MESEQKNGGKYGNKTSCQQAKNTLKNDID